MKSAVGDPCGSSTRATVKIETSAMPEHLSADANARLARQPGVVASFSRALTEGLTAQQSPEEVGATLNAAIASIYAASST